MYTVLRVEKNYNGSTSYAIADWSDSSVDSLSLEEVKKCLQMGFQIEGIALKDDKLRVSPSVPRDGGSDKISPVEGLDKASLLVSYSYAGRSNTMMVVFRVDGAPFYDEGQGTYRNHVISIPTDKCIRVVDIYDKSSRRYVCKNAFVDYIVASDLVLLQTVSKKPLFKLAVTGIDKHFYGEDKEEAFRKEYLLEYQPKTKKFLFVGQSSWHIKDSSEYIEVDNSHKKILLKGSGTVIYSCH